MRKLTVVNHANTKHVNRQSDIRQAQS
jgi:hypothetical protein